MLIISAKSGQLGNRLLLFANFIAFARENNFTVLNPAFEEYAKFFQSTARDLFCCYPPLFFSFPVPQRWRQYYYKFNRYLVESGRFQVINIQRNRPFNWSNLQLIENLQSRKLIFFQGWLFRDGWFIAEVDKLYKHREAIRAYFRPLKKYQENVFKLISRLRQEGDILIGVHIRHGDYRHHQNGKYFFETEQYVKVMQSAQTLFPNQKVTFLICSNVPQPKQCFQHLSYTFGNNHIIEDLYSLAECDYIIGPPSSYTMWASFYGERPLYMLRKVEQTLDIKNFVHFYQWKGVFHYHEDWSQSYWEWTH